MSTTPNTPEPAETDSGSPAARAGGFAWIRAHRKTSIAVGAGAVLAIALAVATPFAVGAVQHQAADDAYQAQRITVTTQARDDLATQKAFTAAATNLNALTPKVGTIFTASDGYLPAELRTKLQDQLEALKKAQALTAGTPATRRGLTGKPTSTTSQLQQYTAYLKEEARSNKKQTQQTIQTTAAKTSAVADTDALLGQVVDGIAASTDKKTKATTPAINGLTADATILLTTYPKADDASKAAVTASAAAAAATWKKKQPVVDQVLDYLTKAAAVKTAHDAQVAAEAAAAAQAAADAAARAGQDTYTDPSTGQTKSTPRSSSGGGGGASNGSGGNGGGGNGGQEPSAPAAPSGPALRVVTDGDYVGSCSVGQVVVNQDWREGMSSGLVKWHGPGAGMPWSYSQNGNILKIWLCA
ncbi:hypothetical protein [Leifsonia aquatica]|uniref:hypothetical protein n=1 Tax=Leifsonia aquatica TaxID=144185 RepID=UPI00380B6630